MMCFFVFSEYVYIHTSFSFLVSRVWRILYGYIIWGKAYEKIVGYRILSAMCDFLCTYI